MTNHTQFSQSPFITIPVTSVPIPHYSQAPTLALAQPVASTSMIHFHSAAQLQSAQTASATAQRTLTASSMMNDGRKVKGLIDLGIEEIKQQHFEEGMVHFQEGYNSLPDSRFYTWLLSRWHELVVNQIRENILVYTDTRLNAQPNDPLGKFVKALCCVRPDLYFLAISLFNEILEENPRHSLTKGLLKIVITMNKRIHKKKSPALISEQIQRDMSLKRLLN